MDAYRKHNQRNKDQAAACLAWKTLAPPKTCRDCRQTFRATDFPLQMGPSKWVRQARCPECSYKRRPLG